MVENCKHRFHYINKKVKKFYVKKVKDKIRRISPELINLQDRTDSGEFEARGVEATILSQEIFSKLSEKQTEKISELVKSVYEEAEVAKFICDKCGLTKEVKTKCK